MLPADPLREGALTVVRTLRAAGFEALFAGGCVRDRVMGHAPKDYDVATDARPDDVMRLFAKTIPVGVQFGVVRVVLGANEYEVATFRAEGGYADGRRPTDVRWADARADVMRRDFTVNGLLEDPLAEEGGEVIDFVGGRADLAAQVIRAIGEPRERFAEDYLRLIRGVRFAARLEFAIDRATWDAMCAMAPSIMRVSAERLGDELMRIVTQGHSARGVELLSDTGLLEHVLPELLGERVSRAVARLSQLGPCAPILGWGAALFDISEAERESVALRLRWSRALARDVAEAVATAHAVTRWPFLSLAERKRAARRATFGPALVIAGTARYRGAEAVARTASAAWTDGDLHPTPLLTGDDLVRAGHAPGPAFKAALEALETAQLEGLARDREGAWRVVEPLLQG